MVSSQCAGAVDNLAGFYFKAVQASNGSPQPAATQVASTVSLLTNVFAAHPDGSVPPLQEEGSYL